MSAPSDTNPFAIALISKEVLLCFFGVYWFVTNVRFEFHLRIMRTYRAVGSTVSHCGLNGKL